MIPVRTLTIAVLSALLAVLVACGGDDATSTPSTPGTPSTTATATGSEGTPSTTATTGEETAEPSEEPSTEPTDEPTDEPTAEPTEEPSEIPVGEGSGCQGKISGEVNQEFSGPGGSSAVGTDYWYTEDEMRAILRQLAEFGGELSEEEIEAEVEEGMARDPRLFLLLLNCVSTDGTVSISLSPSSASKYADVPFEPGTYKIAGGGFLGGSDVPGEWGVLLTVGEGSFAVSDAGGEINITKFDSSGIAGSFSFPAEEIFAEDGTSGTITVEATFEYDCVGQSACD